MKFKVGDRVKLVNISESEKRSIYGKEYINALNKIFTIKNIYDNNWAKLKETIISPYLSDLELISEQFTKSDLKDGDIVTYRNGEKRTIKGNRLVNEDGITTNILINYDDDLTQKNVKENSIVKVERPVQYETVFERKEEILDEVEKRYLRDVIRPFREEVKSIQKSGHKCCLEECIAIIFKNDNSWYFPKFQRNTKYKNMEINKSYTLKELGL